ncbi:MAG: response regulator transcription factor [Variovorax sp.]|nr:response regulator transcription factor [Variovorax sp.]
MKDAGANIRVVLADDHPLIMVGANHLLKSTLNVQAVATAASPEMLMEVLAQGECDVLVTDFSMPNKPGADGLAMLNAIRLRFPRVRVIVLTMIENVGLLQRMRKAGALGVLSKGGDLGELADAVVTVFRNRPFLGRSLRQRMLETDVGTHSGASQSLSPKELEIVRLYAGGKSITEISRTLNRTVNTVSTQKGSAMQKLGVKNDAELYQLALIVGLA